MHSRPMHSRVACFAAIVLIALTGGCGEKDGHETAADKRGAQQQPRAADSSKPAGTPATHWTPDLVDRTILQANPGYQGEAMYQIQEGRVVALQLTGTTITNMPFLANMGVQVLDLRGLPLADLKQIEGLDLVELYAEDTDIGDLEPLRGMHLKQLYLSNTYITDLSPLKDMPLEQLNLLGTDVTDISPLRGMPLIFLWLNQTPVSDISPLSGCPDLMSLTLHRTSVHDLAPLAGTNLKRLHIGETPVADLAPLKDLELKRLIFTPESIRTGLDVVRRMESLEELGTTFENRMPTDVFWHLYDTGSLP